MVEPLSLEVELSTKAEMFLLVGLGEEIMTWDNLIERGGHGPG